MLPTEMYRRLAVTYSLSLLDVALKCEEAGNCNPLLNYILGELALCYSDTQDYPPARKAVSCINLALDRKERQRQSMIQSAAHYLEGGT